VADSDSQIPWFSGLCLEGEVAAQYRLEGREGQEGNPTPPYLELDNLAPITIFVGANNSGKSRLLREIFANLEPVYLKPGGYQEVCGNGASAAGETDSPATIFNALIQEAREWNAIRPDGQANIRSCNHPRKEDWLPSWSFSALQKIGESIEKDYPRAERPGDSEGALIHRAARKWQFELQKGVSQIPHAFQYPVLRRCYVPILRGMRSPRLAQDSLKEGQAICDCFVQRAVDDYFFRINSVTTGRLFGKGLGDHYFKYDNLSVCSGLGIYSDLQSRLLSSEQVMRDSVVKFQDFLGKRFFGGRPVVLVPALQNADGSPNDVVYIKIGSGAERPIHALGDGMQSLIICTYPIVTETQRGSLFFLEEPDLCMHPSLQRTFLEVLKVYHGSMGHQFFVTTHSNHLLDLADDPDLVSILSFTAIGNDEEPASVSGSSPLFRIRSASHRDREVLTQLGVRPSATFLANATIWVEGVSDASYLRAYMEAFVHYLALRGGGDWKDAVSRLRQYKEDQHYAFVEYNGANLEHFSFGESGDASTRDQVAVASPASSSERPTTDVIRLCAQAIVIADGDIAGKGTRLERFRQQLGDRLIVLPGKEIKNLIPESLLRCQVREDHRSPRRGQMDDPQFELISYAEYSRFRGASSDLVGIGTYLGEDRGASKYAGSTTLPGYYKSRWSSSSEGIPRKIRNSLGGDLDREAPEVADSSVVELPPYLTHDLLWLCTGIYRHIAACNYHKEVGRELSKFQDRLRELHQGVHASATDSQRAGAESEGWPIRDASDRRCPLKVSLSSSSPSAASSAASASASASASAQQGSEPT